MTIFPSTNQIKEILMLIANELGAVREMNDQLTNENLVPAFEELGNTSNVSDDLPKATE
jgi:hypothetical protein